MQNEINELRNQVRTLKRVVYGACGLMLVGGVAKWKQILPAKVLILTALLPVLIVGCGGPGGPGGPSFKETLTQNTQKVLLSVSSWKGADFSEVLATWGAPDSVFNATGGDKYYKWNRHGEYRCVVEMVVDGDDVVKKVDVHGQNGGIIALGSVWRPGYKPAQPDE